MMKEFLGILLIAIPFIVLAFAVGPLRFFTALTVAIAAMLCIWLGMKMLA